MLPHIGCVTVHVHHFFCGITPDGGSAVVCMQLLFHEVGAYLGGVCALRGAGRSWYRFNVTAGGALSLKVNAQHCS